MDLYSGLSLDHNRREIRVLVIHQETRHASVNCTLKRLSLDGEDAEFNALSYVWGDATDTREIIINGTIMNVTKSLESALRHIRDYSEPHVLAFDIPLKMLWVDAVCINQNDNSERNHQVQIMREIYAASKTVIMWLGDGNAFTDLAVDRMNSSDFREQLRSLNVSTRVPSLEEIRVEAILKHDLCKRNWWKRLWVRQEFILANTDPFFMCGTKGISWKYFYQCFLSVPRSWNYPQISSSWDTVRQEIGSISGEGRHQGIHPISLDRLRKEFQKKHLLPLYQALRYLLQNSVATDPRDFIYGILGVVDAEDKEQISVDYAIAPMDLYQQVARLLWTRYPEFTLAELIPNFVSHGVNGSYPSWTPDFEKQELRGWRDNWVFQAERPWRFQRNAPLLDDKNHLILSGVTFGTIEIVLSTPKKPENDAETISELKRIEEAVTRARDRQIPEQDFSDPLLSLKNRETMLQTLTKSPLNTEEFCPGLSDEQLWNILIGRERDHSGILTTSDSGRSINLPNRLKTALSGKFFNRNFIITETGFTGIGVPQIEKGDIVTFLHGTTSPLILRPYLGYHRMVGCAYVSGLMEPDILDGCYKEGLLPEEEFHIR